MIGVPRLLSHELLDGLVAALRAQGAPVVSNLSPGLSNSQMEPIVEGSGLSLPEEARTWWGYCNGAQAGTPLSQLFTPL